MSDKKNHTTIQKKKESEEFLDWILAVDLVENRVHHANKIPKIKRK